VFSFTLVRHYSNLPQVALAEFGAKPMVCTAVGSAFPGLGRDQALEALTAGGGGHGGGPGKGPKRREGLDAGCGNGGAIGEEGERCWGHNTIGPGGGGGACGDPFSRRQAAARAAAAASRDCRRDGPVAAPPPRAPPMVDWLLQAAPGDEVICSSGGRGASGGSSRRVTAGDGTAGGSSVAVPAVLRGHADVAYVLNQREGRLRTKDVKVGWPEGGEVVGREGHRPEENTGRATHTPTCTAPNGYVLLRRLSRRATPRQRASARSWRPSLRRGRALGWTR
jgi:hypothetical protein